MISIIVCHDAKGGIAKDGRIPWHIPEDLQFFRQRTVGGIVIMGRKTWDALPKRPLDLRTNIVISHFPANTVGATYAKDYANALDIAIIMHMKIHIIGGLSVYEAALHDDRCTELIVTELKRDYHCDCFFPPYWEAWKEDAILLQFPEGTIKRYVRGDKK